MITEKIYDTAIIGGGLAGLNLSILLQRLGHTVILLEKESYPFHKVCGEYISLESWNFLANEIGVPLENIDVPIIKRLWVTSPDGSSLKTDLDLGGFGISRHKLDFILKEIAEKAGVEILENCKAEDIIFNQNIFTVKTTKGDFKSKVCAGSWGKRSNFDVKWKRSFIGKSSSRLNNYVGIKYHVKMNFPNDVIALHNFKDGYCGMSKIEDDKYCVCYLTKASNIKNAGSIEKAEKEILSQNPHLKTVFENMVHCYDAPLSISQVSFSKKNAVENNILMLGDAAGMITPLCGNGMSMAMHGAKTASVSISAFLNGTIIRNEMEKNYTTQWKQNFATRLATGKLVQYLFGRKTATNLLVKLMKRSNFLTKKIIGLTHGKTF
ncbi:MAG: NAD(P)/FAD-dependent oxidoreductase [Ferruginibacter sp.]